MSQYESSLFKFLEIMNNIKKNIQKKTFCLLILCFCWLVKVLKWITHHRTKKHKKNKKYCKLMWKLRSLWEDEGSKTFQGCLWKKKWNEKKTFHIGSWGVCFTFFKHIPTYFTFHPYIYWKLFNSKHFPRKTDKFKKYFMILKVFFTHEKLVERMVSEEI